MTFDGFTKKDFDVFSINDFDQRMEALKTLIRPKLEYLGQYFAPILASMTNEEMFAHVAKHARRKVNPPRDTWVALATNPRGYKMLPHFQIGLWGSHVFIWLAVIYEAPNKTQYGKVLQSHTNQILSDIPHDFVWSVDHMKPEVIKHAELTEESLTNMFVRLQTIKKAEILCGYQIPIEEAVEMTGDQFIDVAEAVFHKLVSLYKLIH
jgi:uncharacterized protein YktB (UPF0637 family)